MSSFKLRSIKGLSDNTTEGALYMSHATHAAIKVTGGASAAFERVASPAQDIPARTYTVQHGMVM